MRGVRHIVECERAAFAGTIRANPLLPEAARMRTLPDVAMKPESAPMQLRGLEDAAIALEDLAEGRMPPGPRLAAGIAALEATCGRNPQWRDLADALFGLKALSESGAMALDGKARNHASRLADVVRSMIDTL